VSVRTVFIDLGVETKYLETPQPFYVTKWTKYLKTIYVSTVLTYTTSLVTIPTTLTVTNTVTIPTVITKYETKILTQTVPEEVETPTAVSKKTEVPVPEL
jgi:hypothetical protein